MNEPDSFNSDITVIEYLESSMATRLLYKFPDNSAFDFDYSQSSLWSPLAPRRFRSLSSPVTPKSRQKGQFGNERYLFDKIPVSKIKMKIADLVGLKLNLGKSRLKVKKNSKGSEFHRTPTSARKGWRKVLKMSSKRFKKKRDSVVHVKLSDFLHSHNL